jgi:hypothetical protein
MLMNTNMCCESIIRLFEVLKETAQGALQCSALHYVSEATVIPV